MINEIVQELRWDPILGEWVLVSNIREYRPWRKEDFCPFCPGAPETGFGWNTLILDNKYPMLSQNPPKPTSHRFYTTAYAYGRCLVLIETPQHDVDDLSDLGVEKIVEVFNRVRELIAKYREDRFAIYLLYFRNKGVEIGVSLTHPHSQIYILPFIPAKILRELINSNNYYRSRKSCLFCDILREELADKARIVFENRCSVSFVPFYAHWPFEVHVYTKRHTQLLTDLSGEELYDFAENIFTILQGFKKLLNKPMPYIMVLHQAPLKGRYDFYHLHIEIYGVYRISGRLKYAAGMEIGGGNFTYDSTPEKAAEILRNAIQKY